MNRLEDFHVTVNESAGNKADAKSMTAKSMTATITLHTLPSTMGGMTAGQLRTECGAVLPADIPDCAVLKFDADGRHFFEFIKCSFTLPYPYICSGCGWGCATVEELKKHTQTDHGMP